MGPPMFIFRVAHMVKRAHMVTPAYNAGDLGLIPGLGRSPGEENGNTLQYSCLENPMDRGIWLATVHAVAESDMTEQTTHVYFMACPHWTQSLSSGKNRLV